MALEDIISSAIAGHDDNSSSLDTMGNAVTPIDTDDSSSVEGLTLAGNEIIPPAKADGAAVADPLAVVEAPTQDDIDKLLEAEGIKPPVQGQRENRIPYSHTKRIITNAKKKWQTESDAALATERQQFTQAQTEVQRWKAQETLAVNDPDKFMAAMAAIDSRYAKFLQPTTAQVTAPTVAKAEDDPMPQPEKAADGSQFYSPETFQKLMDWNRRQAVRESQAEYEKKYGPMLAKQMEREEASKAYEARLPVVRKQMERLNTTYGAEMVKTHQDAIVAEMKKDDTLTPAEAAAIVLTPILKADETKLREKWLAELKGRPSTTAVVSPGASQVAAVAAPVTGDTESIIKSAIAPYLR